MATPMHHHKVRTTWEAARPPLSGANVVSRQPSATKGRHGFTNAASEAEQTKPRLKVGSIRPADSCMETDGGGYAQAHVSPSTSPSSQHPFLHISHEVYGLPQRLVQNLSSLGIDQIYPWQSVCLRGRKMLTGERNLIYSAPTGGGKSLVADVLMFNRVLMNQKAILVLPYVALVQEKTSWLRRALEGVEKLIEPPTEQKLRSWRNRRAIRVAGFFGGSKLRETWADIDIAVCTIEKANSLVNSAIDDGSIDGLGIAVLDELHMIDDENRGYLLELLGTKLLSLERKIQVVGMSATLSDTTAIANWLDAREYQSRYKPIPLEDFLVYDNSIYLVSSALDTEDSELVPTTQSRGPPCRLIDPSEDKQLSNSVTNAVVALALETVGAGYSALIFCGSRDGCRRTAKLVSKAMPEGDEVKPGLLEERSKLVASLRSLMMLSLDEDLAGTVMRGVGFHHAGLTTEERELVAEAYDKGVLKIIVATCTIAAGVNLPARRVIMNGVKMGRDNVSVAMLRQLRGRAGRKGKDLVGESYVCCDKKDLAEVEELLAAEIPPITSPLLPERRGIKRALLETVAIGLASQHSAIQDFVGKTLLSHTVDVSALSQMTEEALTDLCDSDLIRTNLDGSYEATKLGHATVAAGLAPETGLFIYDEFKRAIQAFVMDGEMHVLYTFTPVAMTLPEIVWDTFRTQLNNLDDSGLRVAEFCNVDPSFVNQMANGTSKLAKSTPEEISRALIYQRFFAALVLRDLCNEVPIDVLSRTYRMQRGQIQSFAQSAQTFASGMIKFCTRMGWGMLAAVLEHGVDRLLAGAKDDLLDLARIPYVKSRTARVLWENGFKNLNLVAEARPEALANVLMLAQPSKRVGNAEEEERYNVKLKMRAEAIIKGAEKLWERDSAIDFSGDM